MAIADFETVDEHLTHDEIRAELDRAARDRFDLSGDEFLEQLRVGHLDEYEPKIARLAVLARLLTN